MAASTIGKHSNIQRTVVHFSFEREFSRHPGLEIGAIGNDKNPFVSGKKARARTAVTRRYGSRRPVSPVSAPRFYTPNRIQRQADSLGSNRQHRALTRKENGK
jgi:hypothetical protein